MTGNSFEVYTNINKIIFAEGWKEETFVFSILYCFPLSRQHVIVIEALCLTHKWPVDIISNFIQSNFIQLYSIQQLSSNEWKAADTFVSCSILNEMKS